MTTFPWAKCLFVMCALGAGFCAGCQPTNPTETSEAKTDTDDVDHSGHNHGGGSKPSGSSKKFVPIKGAAEDWGGNWVLVSTMQGKDIYLWIMSIKGQATDGWTGEIVNVSNPDAKVSVKDLTIQDDVITINFDLDKGGNSRFVGRKGTGSIRGMMSMGDGLTMVRLLPTDSETLEGFERAGDTEGMELFSQITREKQPEKAFAQFGRQFRHAPLGLVAYQQLLSRLATAKIPANVMERLVNEYLEIAEPWGPLAVIRGRFLVLQLLVAPQIYADLADTQVTELSRVDEQYRKDFEQDLSRFREEVSLQKQLQQLKDPETKDKAPLVASLKVLKEVRPFDHRILMALAEEARTTQQLDDAIAYYRELCALPLLQMFVVKERSGDIAGEPFPEQRLLELLKEKHGDQAPEMDAFLSEQYMKTIGELLESAKKTHQPSKEALEQPGPTILCELFTGAVCPPCVAVDLALSALQETYPKSRVVFIQYHVHIPGPDPMTCQASEDRFALYQMQGTPSLLVNGQILNGMASPSLSDVPRIYEALSPLIENLLKSGTATPYSVTASAKVEQGELKIQAEATGIPAEELGNYRMVLALVEDHIRAPMPNGVRDHHYVVRDCLGGAKGVAPIDGALKYDISLRPAELKQSQKDYLSTFEIGRQTKFPSKPLEMKPLSLVAWIQDIKTGEIKQSVLVPVEGELEYPDETK